jgi:hypothetical protein
LRLIAGQDASALYLQQLASHYYAEAARRPTGQVLKEMGLLALEISAVTASSEQLEFGDDETETLTETNDAYHSYEDAFAEASPSERRTRWMEYAARVLGEDNGEERGTFFADELRVQARVVYRKRDQAFAYDEYAEHLSGVSAETEDDDEFAAHTSTASSAPMSSTMRASP